MPSLRIISFPNHAQENYITLNAQTFHELYSKTRKFAILNFQQSSLSMHSAKPKTL